MPNGPILAFDAGILADEQLLKRANFYPGTPNGYTDSAWFAAIKAAQQSFGLPLTGTFDPTTRDRVTQKANIPPTVETPDPVFPRTGPRIAEAQTALRTLEKYTGPVDGQPNEAFDAALRTFQLTERLPTYPRSPTPILDDQTLRKLREKAPAAPAPPPVAMPAPPPVMAPNPNAPPAMVPNPNAPAVHVPAAAPAPAPPSSTLRDLGMVLLLTLPAWGTVLWRRGRR